MRRLLVLVCAAAAAGEPPDEALKRFAAVARASGEPYFVERDALLLRADAAAILRAARERAETEEDRWLAAALLARHEQGAAVADAQRDFREKVEGLARGTGHLLRSGRFVTPAGRTLTVLVPGEDVPEDWRGAAAELDRTRLAASPALRPALAEIALKGIREAPGEHEVRWRALTVEDYRFAALHRLLRDGEPRAVAAMCRLLADQAATERHRAAAAGILGRSGCLDALPELLRLAEREETEPALRDAALLAITSLAHEDAIPVLERIVARGENAPQEPGNVGPRRWALQAKLALRAIRAKR